MNFDARDRTFKVWSYSVTHRSLLLRSDSDLSLKAAPRIEVCADGVQVMFLRPLMKGLAIRRISDGEEADTVARKYGINEYLDRIFLFESTSGEGLIVSGNPSWAKAACPIEAPSFFSRPGEVRQYPDATAGQIE